MYDRVSPERVLACLIEFYKSATLELFCEYFFGIDVKDSNDYHVGKFHKFQNKMGEFLCYLDYEHRRMFIYGILRWAEKYEKDHDEKIYPDK